MFDQSFVVFPQMLPTVICKYIMTQYTTLTIPLLSGCGLPSPSVCVVCTFPGSSISCRGIETPPPPDPVLSADLPVTRSPIIMAAPVTAAVGRKGRGEREGKGRGGEKGRGREGKGRKEEGE